MQGLSQKKILKYSFPPFVVQPLFSRCSVVVQSNTEQRLNNDRPSSEQQTAGQRIGRQE